MVNPYQGTFEADNILNFIYIYIFFFFSANTSLGFSSESSAQQTIHMKSQNLFSLKNTKKSKCRHLKL